jgi:hypothetical protein
MWGSPSQSIPRIADQDLGLSHVCRLVSSFLLSSIRHCGLDSILATEHSYRRITLLATFLTRPANAGDKQLADVHLILSFNYLAK